jgi:hypothetical protein
MSSRKKKDVVQPWRGDAWDSRIYELIEKRVSREFNTLIDVMGIPEYREYPDPAKELLEELVLVFRMARTYIRDVNAAASEAQARKTLEHLIKHPANIVEQVNQADPRTRSLIEKYWPGGPQHIEVVPPDPDAYLESATAAFAALPKPKPGRPPGSDDQASRECALRMADTYLRFTGKSPTRRYDFYSGESGAEYGPFRDFVAAMLSLIPDRLLRSLHPHALGTTKAIDHITRLGIEQLKEKETT